MNKSNGDWVWVADSSIPHFIPDNKIVVSSARHTLYYCRGYAHTVAVFVGNTPIGWALVEDIPQNMEAKKTLS